MVPTFSSLVAPARNDTALLPVMCMIGEYIVGTFTGLGRVRGRLRTVLDDAKDEWCSYLGFQPKAKAFVPVKALFELFSISSKTIQSICLVKNGVLLDVGRVPTTPNVGGGL